MAKSKSFFGPRRGSTKSLTFQVVNGQQITKERVSEVKNPKTSSQAVQRMKLAPAQKFYSAFEAVLNHAYQGVQYGDKSRQHFMSLAMKQNGGPYVVKGYNGLVPGTYLVAEGNIPEVMLTADFGALSVSTSINFDESLTPSERAQFVEGILNSNPWIVEGDKLTFLYVMDYNGVYYADKKQIVVKAVLSEGESDDFNAIADTFSQTEGKLEIAIDDTPWQTSFAIMCGMAIIISRGTSQTKDERSNARMVVSDDIIGRFYSTEAYEIAMASYQADSSNPIGDEWYLNNFAVGDIGRVGARSVTVDGHSSQILELIITEAGVNKHYILVNGQYCVLPSGARAPFQPSAAGLDGIPTAPWSPSYLTLFSGFNTPGADNFAAAQAARALGCELSDLKVTNVPNITVHNGSATLTAEVAVAFNGRSYAEGNPCVVLTLTQEGQTFPAHAHVDGGRVYNLDDLNFGKPIANCVLSVLNVAATIAADDQSFSGFPYASSGPRPRPVPPAPETSLQKATFLLGGAPTIAYLVKVNNLPDCYGLALALSPNSHEFVAIGGLDESGDAFTRATYKADVSWDLSVEEWANAISTFEAIKADEFTSINGYPSLGAVPLDNSIMSLLMAPSGENAIAQLLMAYGITQQQFDITFGGGDEKRVFIASLINIEDNNGLFISASQEAEAIHVLDDMGISQAVADSIFIIGPDTSHAQAVDINEYKSEATPIGNIITEGTFEIDPVEYAQSMDTQYATTIGYDESLAYITQIRDT